MGSDVRLPGNRIVKTTVAVFLTAWICILLDWPPVFAVITAIVTLEPTVKDSIQKGLVRFPASAIGSFYAVVFISIFGHSPLTYTLAASLTILTCYRLKLHAGLLVATITAVAMVEVIIDNYFLSFFIRLGTTTIGLIVSTLVNMFIFPPQYMKQIKQNFTSIYKNLAEALLVLDQKNKAARRLDGVRKQLHKTEQLIRYEVDEVSSRPFFEKEDEDKSHLLDDLHHVELIHYHMQNIQPIALAETAFSDDEREVIEEAVDELAQFMLGQPADNLHNFKDKLNKLMQNFWRINHDKASFRQEDRLPDELVFLYELISIYYLVLEKKPA